MAAAITTRGLAKSYGDTPAVKGIDLEVREGEVFGLLGPNGAGKTTTILMLLGLTEPTAGDLEVLGLDPRHHALDVKAAVGYLPDAVGFYENLTGRQNLRYTTRLNHLPDGEAERRVGEVIEMVGLRDVADREAAGYSRGMRQRFGLADALLKKPSVLILDEPTVNIDPAGVEEILSLVRRLADEQGVAVLLSSHLLHQVQEICDRIGIFVAGELVAVGSIGELADGIHDDVLIEVAASGPAATVRSVIESVDGVLRVENRDGLLLVAARSDLRPEIVGALGHAGCSLLHLRRAGAQLDAIYRRYFHKPSGSAEEPAVTDPIRKESMT
ncbi:MAG: ABC transporter ATP-binding protein [Acidimicrobiales bacterium]